MSQNVALLDIDETTSSAELFEILHAQNIKDVYLYANNSQKLTTKQEQKIKDLVGSLKRENFVIKNFRLPHHLSSDEISSHLLYKDQDIKATHKKEQLLSKIPVTSKHIAAALQDLETKDLNQGKIKINPRFLIKPNEIQSLIKGKPATKGKPAIEGIGIERFLNEKLKLYVNAISTNFEQKKNEFYHILNQNIAAENFPNILRRILQAQNLNPLTNYTLAQLQLNSLKQTLITLDNSTNKKEKTLKQKGLELVTYADKLLKQKTKLDDESLNDLSKVLRCANKAIDERSDPIKTKANVIKLSTLSQQVSKKPASIWKKIGAVLLTIACAALVVAGVLAAIPSGGSSLLLSTIGGIGLASQIGIGVGVGVTAGLGAASLAKGLKTNPVTKFKAALEKLQESASPASQLPSKGPKKAQFTEMTMHREYDADEDMPEDHYKGITFKDLPEMPLRGNYSPFKLDKISKFNKEKLGETYLAEWNRIQPPSTKVTIDGRDIREIVNPEQPTLFKNIDECIKFIKTNLLKNVPDAKHEDVIRYLHQGGLLHPVTTAAMMSTTLAGYPAYQHEQTRTVNFRTTKKGFQVEEITTQKSVLDDHRQTRDFSENKTLPITDYLITAAPDSRKDYVYKARGIIDINCIDKPTGDLPFKLTVVDHFILYGNETVKKALSSLQTEQSEELDNRPKAPGP